MGGGGSQHISSIPKTSKRGDKESVVLTSLECLRGIVNNQLREASGRSGRCRRELELVLAQLREGFKGGSDPSEYRVLSEPSDVRLPRLVVDLKEEERGEKSALTRSLRLAIVLCFGF